MTILYKQKYLKRENNHIIAYREYGNPTGIPILMFHGGPGGEINYNNIELIDLNFFHLFTIDQRGCGKSTPAGSLSANTTNLLIEDIEKIRQTENLEKCIIFGRSWGTTLGLLYALKYPENCRYLVLRAVFLGRDCDEEWTFSGSKIKFPEQWSNFSKDLNPKLPLNKQFYDKLFGGLPQTALKFSAQMTRYFNILATNDTTHPDIPETNKNLTANKIFLHYSTNHYFFDDTLWEKELAKLDQNNIKGIILHGEKDNDCLVSQARYLHSKWKNSHLIIEPTASHCDNQPEIRKQIKNIFIALKKRLS